MVSHYFYNTDKPKPKISNLKLFYFEMGWTTEKKVDFRVLN